VKSAEKNISPGPVLNDLQIELQAKKTQLHWLLQITKAINYNFSTKQLLDVYEHVLCSQLKVEKFALLIFDDVWKCPLLSGTDRSLEEFNIGNVLTELNKLHKLETEQELWVKTFESILPVYHKDQLLAYALIGGLGNAIIPKKSELCSFIHTITNLIVVAVENNQIAHEKIRQAGIRKELELAATMQSMLFPVSLPKSSFYDIHATYLPHQEVGGDYYDFIQKNSNEFIFCMADVSGKGIPAALLMSNFQANLHALLDTSPTLPELIKRLNEKVYRSAKGEKFITFFIGQYNIKTRQLHYVNAGHNPPFLIHEKVVYMLNDGATGLGMFEELPFINQGKTYIPPNAMLHCYTDGVIDVENERGEDYGMQRLSSFFTERKQLHDMKAIHQQLVQTLSSFKESNPYTDDITLLSLLFKN
jgi:sigma-B regulation protein RsbU (phosphoserine phosphatase)